MSNEEEEDRNHPSSAVAVLAAVNVSGEKATMLNAFLRNRYKQQREKEQTIIVLTAATASDDTPMNTSGEKSIVSVCSTTTTLVIATTPNNSSIDQEENFNTVPTISTIFMGKHGHHASVHLIAFAGSNVPSIRLSALTASHLVRYHSVNTCDGSSHCCKPATANVFQAASCINKSVPVSRPIQPIATRKDILAQSFQQ